MAGLRVAVSQQSQDRLRSHVICLMSQHAVHPSACAAAQGKAMSAELKEALDHTMQIEREVCGISCLQQLGTCAVVHPRVIYINQQVSAGSPCAQP